MKKSIEAISLGELVVEFFRVKVGVPFSQPSDVIGPFPSGAPAIFIDTFSKLGGKSGFIGTVGHDDFAECIINRLKDDNVDTKHIIKLDDTTTGVSFTNYFEDGSRKFIYHISNAACGLFSPEHIDEDYILSSKWLHISGNVLFFSKSAREAIYKAIDIAYKNDIPISFDPNIRLEISKKESLLEVLLPVLEKSTMFLPSEGEIKFVTGLDDELNAIKSLFESSSIKIIAKKEGKKGCTIFTADKTATAQAFNDIIPIDPTGCGDAFAAAMVYGYLNNMDIEELALFANAVGGITSSQKGAMNGVSSLSQVIEFLKENGIELKALSR